jgi:F-type H+-transporting ATPase subunit b
VRNAIITALDDYSFKVTKNLRDAEALLVQAEEMHKQITAQYKEAEAVAQEIIEAAKEDAELTMQEAIAQAQAITQKKTELAIARITLQEQQIMEDLKNKAIETAFEKVNSALIQELNKQTQLSVIHSSLSKTKKRAMN